MYLKDVATKWRLFIPARGDISVDRSGNTAPVINDANYSR